MDGDILCVTSEADLITSAQAVYYQALYRHLGYTPQKVPYETFLRWQRELREARERQEHLRGQRQLVGAEEGLAVTPPFPAHDQQPVRMASMTPEAADLWGVGRLGTYASIWGGSRVESVKVRKPKKPMPSESRAMIAGGMLALVPAIWWLFLHVFLPIVVVLYLAPVAFGFCLLVVGPPLLVQLADHWRTNLIWLDIIVVLVGSWVFLRWWCWELMLRNGYIGILTWPFRSFGRWLNRRHEARHANEIIPL